MFDMDDLLRIVWSAIKLFFRVVVYEIILLASPAMLIRCAVARKWPPRDFDDGFWGKVLWGILDILSWGLVIVLVVDIVNRV